MISLALSVGNKSLRFLNANMCPLGKLAFLPRYIVFGTHKLVFGKHKLAFWLVEKLAFPPCNTVFGVRKPYVNIALAVAVAVAVALAGRRLLAAFTERRILPEMRKQTIRKIQYRCQNLN
jgi:hypothetical protein